MRLALSVLLIVFVALAATTEKVEDNYYPLHYGQNMLVGPRFLITSTTTTTTVTVSTSVIICTSGAFAGLANQGAIDALPACSGRRRRGILELLDGENDEQFSIAPSVVQRVEATQVPNNLANNRETRAADPQYFVVSPFGHSYYPQEIQSGFYGTPYNYGPDPLPYYGSYAQPAAGNRIFLSTILQAVLPPFLKQTSTVTVTSTSFTVSTSTSVATCKPPPAALKCLGT